MRKLILVLSLAALALALGGCCWGGPWGPNGGGGGGHGGGGGGGGPGPGFSRMGP